MIATIPACLPDLDRLTLRQQIAQMVVVRASGFLMDAQIRYPAWEPIAPVLASWIGELGVGGVILLGGSAAEIALRTHEFQTWAPIPLLIAADIEEGVGQRFAGATQGPPLMAIGAVAQRDLPQAIALAQAYGALTADEARAIGLNWLLGPVVDVNNNPDNPVINVRSFGDCPAIVGQLAAAFIAGARQRPILTAAKHFPGHGDTAIDSHLELPVIPHDRARLAAIELPPFVAAIAAGVDAVMSAHLQIPALDATYPATLSRSILTDLLRHELGFEGLIVTDALVMGAIARRYGANEAPVLAVEAGADILLMAVDPPGAIEAVAQAVEAGRIVPERIRASVERIWRSKARIFDSEAPAIAPPQAIDLRHHLAQPQAQSTVDQLLIASQQGGNGSLALPTAATPSDRTLANEDLENLGTLAEVAQTATSPVQIARNLIALDDAIASDYLGQFTPAIAWPRQWGIGQLQIVDSYSPVAPDSIATLAAQGPTLLQIFARGNPFRGSAGLTQGAIAWLTALRSANTLAGVILYGSPYLLDRLRPLLGVDIPYRFSYGQMPRAQAIALASLFDQPIDAGDEPYPRR
ncbi:MAG: beta-glucosidase [Oscillatoriales cyanobacterium]|nr:MAG: beta-glucosidase [Oscillatoriales cyanobacterium]